MTFATEGAKLVRVGIVGLGRRGTGLLGELLKIPGVAVGAVFDRDAGQVARARELVRQAGAPCPDGYADDSTRLHNLLCRSDLEAIVIATNWESHAAIAIESMKCGKYAAVEVPIALTLEECWQLVDTSEQTGVPCMMLENWSFRRDNLAVLKMIRGGLFGEIVHCHCAHSHDCIGEWYFAPQGNDRWPVEYLLRKNADQYPTHSLGPVLSWMDINCGDSFAYLTSTATDSRGINSHFERRFGPDHPAARRRYAQGDIVTTVVRTKRGKTVVINNDMQLPRPYDNRWLVQGTLGLYDEARSSVYITGRTAGHVEWEPFESYQAEFDHEWWKELGGSAGAGHEGTDYLELSQFIEAVRHKTQPPVDVYDSVVMSAIIPLSEKSIAEGSAPINFPDFTRGKWQTREPSFALEK